MKAKMEKTAEQNTIKYAKLIGKKMENGRIFLVKRADRYFWIPNHIIARIASRVDEAKNVERRLHMLFGVSLNDILEEIASRNIDERCEDCLSAIEEYFKHRLLGVSPCRIISETINENVRLEAFLNNLKMHLEFFYLRIMPIVYIGIEDDKIEIYTKKSQFLRLIPPYSPSLPRELIDDIVEWWYTKMSDVFRELNI